MKKQFLFLLTAIFSLNCYSQINFEEGYFIDNTGNKRNVLIKNVDWKNNPVSFDYKTSEDAEIKTGGISSVREFGVDNISKYRRGKVEIDRSDEKMANLSAVKEPDFKQEELFLRVLVEGKATLYQYRDADLTRYYYSNENSEIQPLIYKSYAISRTQMGENNKFRQQLYNDLECPSFTTSRFQNLDYVRKDLVRLFREYHKCHDAEITFEPKVIQAQFNISLRPRFNSSSLIIQNPDAQPVPVDFGGHKGFGFGAEAELTLPFNRNKWSLFIEPTYQYFKGTAANNNSDAFQRNHLFEADYKSVELPVGLRHYFFLNNNSKIFLNAAFVVDFTIKSSITYAHEDGSNYRHLDVQSQENLAMGLGYKYNDRYSLEIRYYTRREILGEYIQWFSDYKEFSVILGYTIF